MIIPQKNYRQICELFSKIICLKNWRSHACIIIIVTGINLSFSNFSVVKFKLNLNCDTYVLKKVILESATIWKDIFFEQETFQLKRFWLLSERVNLRGGSICRRIWSFLLNEEEVIETRASVNKMNQSYSNFWSIK